MYDKEMSQDKEDSNQDNYVIPRGRFLGARKNVSPTEFNSDNSLL